MGPPPKLLIKNGNILAIIHYRYIKMVNETIKIKRKNVSSKDCRINWFIGSIVQLILNSKRN